MGRKDRKRLLGEVAQLQNIIQERRNKREPFLSSLADALESAVKKAKEWFESESELAKREIAILDELLPEPSLAEEESKLKAHTEEFQKTTTKFNSTIKSIREGEVKNLRDFLKGEGMFTPVPPEFIDDLKKIFEVCVKLEELIERLEQSAKYISVAFRIVKIYAEGKD